LFGNLDHVTLGLGIGLWLQVDEAERYPRHKVCFTRSLTVPFFARSAALAEVCALLSAILVT